MTEKDNSCQNNPVSAEIDPFWPKWMIFTVGFWELPKQSVSAEKPKETPLTPIEIYTGSGGEENESKEASEKDNEEEEMENKSASEKDNGDEEKTADTQGKAI